MSYQVLARKWRPRTFGEMVGQEHVLRALINALDNDRLHHAFLFTGTRGVGKTTIARILAKSLNCEQGVGSQPCGECSACREIDEGRFVDLIEVDAASRTRVEDTRELMDNVQYAPTRGRYKVYLIDEVHMLSTHSFNALLKTLEEPPPHVKFLLATTDPQRLPVTILSRCLQFSLKPLPLQLIAGHVTSILEREGIEAEPAAVIQVARAADGSMRDALSLLDQAIAFGGGRLVEDEVRAMLGTVAQGRVVELLDALAAGDAAAVLAVVDGLAQQSPDFAGVLAELITLLHHVAVARLAPDAVDENMGDPATIADLAARLPAEDVQLYYQIALHGRRDLPLAPDPRAGFEMTLLRMLAFRPAAGGDEAAEPGTGGTAAVPGAGGAGAGGHAGAAAVRAALDGASTRGAAPAPKREEGAPVAPPAEPVSAGRPEPGSETRITPSASAGAEAAAPAETPESVADEEPESRVADATPVESAGDVGLPTDARGWAALVENLDLRGITRQIALHARPLAHAGSEVRLAVAATQQHMLGEKHEARLADALGAHLGVTVRVRLEAGEAVAETPAELAESDREARQAAAVEAIENDPNVRAMQEAFDAELRPESIRPGD